MENLTNPGCAFTQPPALSLCPVLVSAAEVQTTEGAGEVIFFFFFAIDTWGRSTAGHHVQHVLLVFQQDLMQERQLREIPKGITGKEAPQARKQKVAQKGWLKW